MISTTSELRSYAGRLYRGLLKAIAAGDVASIQDLRIQNTLLRRSGTISPVVYRVNKLVLAKLAPAAPAFANGNESGLSGLGSMSGLFTWVGDAAKSVWGAGKNIIEGAGDIIKIDVPESDDPLRINLPSLDKELKDLFSSGDIELVTGDGTPAGSPDISNLARPSWLMVGLAAAIVFIIARK